MMREESRETMGIAMEMRASEKNKVLVAIPLVVVEVVEGVIVVLTPQKCQVCLMLQ